MDASDAFDLLNPEATEPDVRTRAQALATALRGQQQQAQQQQLLGSLGAAFGNKAATSIGNAYGDVGTQQYADAQSQLQQLAQLPGQRLKQALERQQLTKDQRENQTAADRTAALADPNSVTTRALAGLGQRVGLNLPAGAPGTAYDEVLPLAEKTFEAEENRKMRLALERERQQGAAAKAKAKGDTKLDDALGKLGGDIDPSSGRGAGLFGKDQGLVAAAQKIRALVHGVDGTENNYNLKVTQVPEFVQSVAAMLSNGGTGSEHQMERLNPKTAGMSLAQKIEWLTGHPEEANVPEFIKLYDETAAREMTLAQKRIRDVQLRRLSRHAGLYGAHPEEFRNTVRDYLPDLTDEQIEAAVKGKSSAIGAPAATGGAGSPAAGGLTAEQMKRLAELRAKREAGALK